MINSNEVLKPHLAELSENDLAKQARVNKNMGDMWVQKGESQQAAFCYQMAGNFYQKMATQSQVTAKNAKWCFHLAAHQFRQAFAKSIKKDSSLLGYADLMDKSAQQTTLVILQVTQKNTIAKSFFLTFLLRRK